MVLIKNTFDLTVGLITIGTVIEISGKGLKFFPQTKSVGTIARTVGRVFQNCAAAILIAPLLESSDEKKIWSVYLIRLGLCSAVMAPVHVFWHKRALWQGNIEDRIFYTQMISHVAKIANVILIGKIMLDSVPHANLSVFYQLAALTFFAI